MRNIAGLPGGEKFFELGIDFGERGVADDEQGGVVGFVPSVVKLGEIGAGHFVDAVGGAGAEEAFRRRDDLCRRAAWEERADPWEGRDFFALDGGEAFFLQALEFFFGERRMEDEVGVNVESLDPY